MTLLEDTSQTLPKTTCQQQFPYLCFACKFTHYLRNTNLPTTFLSESSFAKYKDETAPSSEPVIGPDGLENFCSDLEISSEDVLLLVVAYHLNAQEMGYFTQAEFIDGFEKLGYVNSRLVKHKQILTYCRLDSIEGIRHHVHSKFKAELDDPEIFKAIYRFAFFFAKEDSDKKVVGKFVFRK